MAKVQANGTTITFATSPFVAKIISSSLDGETADDVETSDLSTLDFRTYDPGFLKEGGTVTYELQVDVTDTRIATGLKDVATQTYPPSTSGATQATRVFDTYVNSYSEALAINELITATMVLKVASVPVFTPETP